MPDEARREAICAPLSLGPSGKLGRSLAQSLVVDVGPNEPTQRPEHRLL